MTRTLHDLTREEGHDVVAASIGITPRALTNKRAGINPLTVDDLYHLTMFWPDFDLARTVDRIGRERWRRRCNTGVALLIGRDAADRLKAASSSLKQQP